MAQTGSYLTTVTSSSDATTYTFTQATHGQSPAAGVLVLMVSGQNGASARTVSTVTVGGNSATQQATTGSVVRHISCWTYEHAGGDLGSIVVTLSASGNRQAVSLFFITERTDITLADSDTGDTTDPLSGTVDTTTNTFVVAAVSTSAGGAFTWTNLTERYDAVVEGVNQWSAASDTITSAGTVSPSADASGSMADGQILVVAFNLSTATTMTASRGTYTYTGVAAGLLQSLKLAAGVGTYALTGVAAGTILAWKMLADVGTYILTGIDATMRYGQILIAEAGAYVVAGIDAVFRIAVSIAAGTGAYVYTGVSAGLIGGFKVVAEVGAYVLTGVDVIFLKGQRMVADAGAYVLTGIATAKHIVLQHLTGAYVYTGMDAAVGLARKIFANAGSYALTGLNAVLVYRLPLPDPVAWTRRKAAPTLAVARRVAASLFKRRQVQSSLTRRRQSDPSLGD